jgi:hypothetical protein
MIKQTMHIDPRGIIESGRVTLLLDEVTGRVDIDVRAMVGFSIFANSIDKVTFITLDPKFLQSENIKKDLKLNVSPVGISIDSVDKSLATALISVNNDDFQLKGSATIDLSGSVIKLGIVHLVGKASGFDVELVLR